MDQGVKASSVFASITLQATVFKIHKAWPLFTYCKQQFDICAIRPRRYQYLALQLHISNGSSEHSPHSTRKVLWLLLEHLAAKTQYQQQLLNCEVRQGTNLERTAAEA